MAEGEQRIEVLEDEMKVLKGEVSRTLIDLRALLMSEDSPLMTTGLSKRIVGSGEASAGATPQVNLAPAGDPNVTIPEPVAPVQAPSALAGVPGSGGIDMPQPPGAPSEAFMPSQGDVSPAAVPVEVVSMPSPPAAGAFDPAADEERARQRRARLQEEEAQDEAQRAQRARRREQERAEEEADRERRKSQEREQEEADQQRRDRRKQQDQEEGEERERRDRRRQDERADGESDQERRDRDKQQDQEEDEERDRKERRRRQDREEDEERDRKRQKNREEDEERDRKRQQNLEDDDNLESRKQQDREEDEEMERRKLRREQDREEADRERRERRKSQDREEAEQDRSVPRDGQDREEDEEMERHNRKRDEDQAEQEDDRDRSEPRDRQDREEDEGMERHNRRRDGNRAEQEDDRDRSEPRNGQDREADEEMERHNRRREQDRAEEDADREPRERRKSRKSEKERASLERSGPRDQQEREEDEKMERLSGSQMSARDWDAEPVMDLSEQEAEDNGDPMGLDAGGTDFDDEEYAGYGPDDRSDDYLPSAGQDQDVEHDPEYYRDGGRDYEIVDGYAVSRDDGYSDDLEDDWDFPPAAGPKGDFDSHRYQEEPKINENNGSRRPRRPDAGRRAYEDNYFDDRHQEYGRGPQNPPRSQRMAGPPAHGRGGPGGRRPAPGNYGYAPNAGRGQWGQTPAGNEQWPGPQEWAPDPPPMDLNLVSSLVRWASLAKYKVGEKRLSNIIELYVESRSAPPGLKEALNHIASIVDDQPPESGQSSQETLDLIAHLHGILTAALPVPEVPQIHSKIGFVAGNGASDGSGNGDW